MFKACTSGASIGPARRGLVTAVLMTTMLACDRDRVKVESEDPEARRVREQRRAESEREAAVVEAKAQAARSRELYLSKIRAVHDALLRLEKSSDTAGPRFAELVDELDFQVARCGQGLSEAERQIRSYAFAADALREFRKAQGWRDLAEQPFPAYLYASKPHERGLAEIEWTRERLEYRAKFRDELKEAFRSAGAARRAAEAGM